MENGAAKAETTSYRQTAARQVSARARCTVCRCEDKWRVEILKAGGASSEALAKKFNLSADAVDRHWRNHVSDQAKAGYLAGPANLEHLAQKAAEEGDSVLDYLKVCRGALLAQLAALQESGDARNVGYISGQLTRTLEAMARITGELGSLAGTVNVQNNIQFVAGHPAFLRLQSTILKALQAHPQARADVARALRALDDDVAPAPAAATGNGKLIELAAAHVT